MPLYNEDIRKTGKPNRLVSEKSPYLLQHAYNPVDWHPWGEEAFHKARREDRPVFLSIGYSTCHWCHVMEKESFEDPEVAALMNDVFVNVKVDREERPDLDHVYMAVCQTLTGRGGWPMTILMTPEKKPFYAGTYTPKGDRFGQPGMLSLVPHIRRLWKERRGEILHSADSILQAIKEVDRYPSKRSLDAGFLDSTYDEFLKQFDPVYGGFGQAPKFPSPHHALFLLRFWKRTGKTKALHMVEKTLREMRFGGIFDQIGYGFHRYSTDREWLVPHFEKMLYDQAMLSLAYLETYQSTGDAFYGETAKEVFTYLLRDMASPEGGFYSAEDADSEGVEGRFYIWRKEEILNTLGPGEGELFCRIFHVEKNGNFFEEATHRNTGANILHLRKGISEIASDVGLSPEILKNRITTSAKRLFEVRERRPRPYKDDKILTDWNGLTIAALARGSRVLDEPLYKEAAEKAVNFILTRMRRGDGRLLHRYREGEAGIMAHLDDYAFLIWGLIELYEATYQPRYLKEALGLNEEMLAHFWDGEEGGLFFVADDAETLILRNKEAYDGAIPSGNGVAMLNLLMLARLTGITDLEHKAERIGMAFSGQITQMPFAFSQFLIALDFALGPSREVVVVGPSGGEGTTEMLRALKKIFHPSMLSLFRPSEQETPEIDEVVPFLRTYVPLGGKPTAYVCTGLTCKAPTTEIREMLGMLKQGPKDIQ